MQEELKESIRRDAKKGINKKESENEFILREACKFGIMVTFAATTILFVLQVVTLGFPNFGVYFVVFTMLLATSIYKAKKQKTLKSQLGIMIAESMFWVFSLVGTLANIFFNFPY